MNVLLGQKEAFWVIPSQEHLAWASYQAFTIVFIKGHIKI